MLPTYNTITVIKHMFINNKVYIISKLANNDYNKFHLSGIY